MKTNGKFYIVNEHNDKIKAAFLTPLPILWNCDGQFRVIPKEIVQNAIDLHETFTQQKFKVTIPVINIMWSQGIPINNQAGRTLIGE